VVAHASRGVDTPADYERFVNDYRRLHPARGMRRNIAPEIASVVR